MANSVIDVQKAYLAYFGRPADYAGLAYWMNSDAATMRAGFAASPEYAALYSGMTASQRVEQVYQNLLGRASDPAGKAYWVNEFNAGHETVGSLVASMQTNALGIDIGTINNRVTYSILFTAQMDTPAEVNGYKGAAAAIAARDAMSHISYTDASLATAKSTLVADTASVVAGVAPTPTPAPAPAPDPKAPLTFTLTTANDSFTGLAGNDTFNGTWTDGNPASTFNVGDVLNGGAGTDTLNIISASTGAMTLTDANWVLGGVNALIENITVNNNAGAGAISFTTGGNFNTAFATGGVALTTSAGAGATTIDMGATPFTGAATIIATASGAGAITITSGSGAATVNATTLAGAETINGTGLTSVTITSTGAGVQTVGSVGLTNNLVTITATQNGAGDQVLTSTSASAVTVNAANNGTGGNQTIVTGAGADTITLSGSYAASIVNITGGAGADTITLKAGHTGANTINLAAGSMAAVGVNTSADSITGFAVATDKLAISITGQAGSAVVNGGDALVVAGAAVVQHALTATATTIASATNVLVLDAVYANAAAVATAIAAGGSTALTNTTANTANNDYVIAWTDGTNSHLSLVNNATVTATAWAAASATLTEVATLVGVTTVAGLAAADFAFIA